MDFWEHLDLARNSAAIALGAIITLRPAEPPGLSPAIDQVQIELTRALEKLMALTRPF